MNPQDASNYTQTGNAMAIAGLGVLLLSKLGVSTDVSTLLAIFGGVVGLIGVIKQIYTHYHLKNQAIATGAIKR